MIMLGRFSHPNPNITMTLPVATLVWALPRRNVYILDSSTLTLIKRIQCRPVPGKFTTISEHLEVRSSILINSRKIPK